MQRGPARHPSKVVQAGPAQRRVTAAQGNAELPERPRDEGISREARAPGLDRVVSQGTKQRQRKGPEAPERRVNIFAERDGRKGSPAGNKARCNRTNTPHSKAMQRKAKPNQTPQTHTRGARQA
jgi:hypothetical protein